MSPLLNLPISSSGTSTGIIFSILQTCNPVYISQTDFTSYKSIIVGYVASPAFWKKANESTTLELSSLCRVKEGGGGGGEFWEVHQE